MYVIVIMNIPLNINKIYCSKYNIFRYLHKDNITYYYSNALGFIKYATDNQ